MTGLLNEVVITGIIFLKSPRASISCTQHDAKLGVDDNSAGYFLAQWRPTEIAMGLFS
ncbi:UNVERIFIED_CONTAM: hypothetical protein Sradi_0487300 [Sesamum radiatum]|uniref:Uncharacterized protein n=1 Tax=Sesamum radiatum TaxID=300843 RepID=A0AAW2W7W5_SESRA